jgi:hypothetical protein
MMIIVSDVGDLKRLLTPLTDDCPICVSAGPGEVAFSYEITRDGGQLVVYAGNSGQPYEPPEPTKEELWNQKATRVAYHHAPTIYECKKCGDPVAEGFCCTYCGNSNPSTTITKSHLERRRKRLGQ